MKTNKFILSGLLIFGILFFSTQDSLAQLNFSVLANVGGATINNHDGSELRIGAFNIGGAANYALSDVLALEGQASFANRGDKYEVEEMIPFVGTVKAEGDIQLNYVQIAAILQYVTEQFTVGVGPSVGILMSAKDKGDATIGGSSESYDEDFKDDAESTEIGANLEILFNATDQLGLGITGQMRLTDIIKDNPGDEWTNTFFGIAARYRITDN